MNSCHRIMTTNKRTNMASSTYKTGSEEVIDYMCSTCYKKKRERESDKFCRECNKYFCSKCLQHHNAINDDHTLQEPSKGTSQMLLPTERCWKHPTKIIDTFCKDHDEVCCNMCAFDDHRSCKRVLYIPREVGQLFKRKELKKAKAGLDRVKGWLTEGALLRESWAEKLKTEREKQLSGVDSYVDTLVTIIRNLGKAEKKMLVNKFKEEENKLQQNTDNFQEVMTNIQKCCSQLDSHDQNIAQLFVNIKNSQMFISNAEKLVMELEEITKHKPPQFKSDRQIEQYLDGLQTLRSAVGKPVQMEKKQHIKNQTRSTSTQSPTLYKVDQRQDINIRTMEDTNKCYIKGSCLLLDGSLLLSDYNNKKLKRLDTTTYKVTDHCDLPDHPHGVCCINQQEAAVCLVNNTVQFISLSCHKMALIRSIKLTHNCFGISYWDNKLSVSNMRDDILFYTLSGSLIKSGNLGLSSTRNITFSQSGDALFIADRNLGLIGIDKSGQEIFRYSSLGLAGCTSVCVDSSGSVFIGDWKSRNVVQVTERGQSLGEVVQRSTGIQEPEALSFDSSIKRLFVAGRSDTVTVIEMK